MPPMRLSRLDPLACSMRPPVRNSEVFTTMWWMIEKTTRGDAGDGEEPEPHDHVADLADDRERQDPPDVVLRDGAEDADDHRRAGEHEQQRGRSCCRAGRTAVWVRMIA